MKKLPDYLITAMEILADETSAVAAIIDMADDYRIVWVNRKLEELLAPVGVSPAGMRWGGRCPFAYGANAIEAVDRVVKTGQPVRGEEKPFGTRVSSRFGETTYWNWKCLPAMTEDCPGCVLVMAENVTDHVARRVADASRRMLFSGVILDLPVGVAIIDPSDFRIVDANDILLSYLRPEHQTRDSIGKTLDEVMPNLEYSGLSDVLRRVASSRELFVEPEFELKDPDRGSIWWNLSARIVDIEGGREGLLVTAWEVSDQVHARNRLEMSRQRARAMLQVQQAISSSLALDQVLTLITDAARELLDSAASSVFLLSGDGRTFVPRGASGISVPEDCAAALSSEGSLAIKALRDRRPVALADAGISELACLPILDSGRQVVTVAAAPIEGEESLIGVLEVYNDSPRRFTNDELETLHALASGAATAIVNAGLYEEAKRSRDELQARNRALDNERKLLSAVIESIPDAVSVADPTRHVVLANHAARRLFGIEEGRIVSLEELLSAITMTTVDKQPILTEDHPFSRALRGEDVRDFEFRHEDTTGRMRYRSVSSGPVKDGDGSIIYAVQVGRDITEQKIAQAKLEEAYERERRIAQTLQQSLLSDVPSATNGLSFAVRYEAGLAEAELGGDFYDVFSPAEGTVAVVIGDVSGKGLAAAIQIAMAKFAVRSYAYEDSSPASVLSRANDAVSREQVAGKFVTLFYALIDPWTREISYASAGHQPGLLRRGDGRVEMLHADGIVLGVLPGFEYDQNVVEMQPGDRLLLYTDGITEARKESGEMLGEERLIEFWAGPIPDGAEASLEAVYQWAREFSEGHFHDDVAMLVISAEE